MEYIKKTHSIQSGEGYKIHLKEDYGSCVEGNKYMLPFLFTEMFLAKNLSKEQAFEMYEEIEINKLDKYKKEWKEKLIKQIELEKQQKEAQEPELEALYEEDE